ncbi:chorion class B protein PC10-like [Maniola jurtina]|uniref:chorion class B protein PC10-like n=1 Tax=Maniola jurtina TaxID=191418 RepID=UPI001E68A046|nr:chorion class B protein PC10-like [Maniola jurtina]
MAAKAILLFCAQALFVQVISAQCIGAAYNGIADGLVRGPVPFAAPWNALPYPEAALAAPCAGFAPAAAYGGGFPVRSASPIAVTGVSMTSENVYEGPLAVSGAVPFLGAVALEGGLPSVGAGAVSYGCGNGNVGMLTEGIDAINGYAGPYGYGAGAGLGYGYPLGLEAGIAGPGYGYGYNRGCGCGALY